MSLNTFGVTPSDVTVDVAGNAIGGVQLTAWTTKDRTVQVTNLFELDGTTPLPGYVTSTAAGGGIGRYPFMASDVYPVLWLWDGNVANDPWLVLSAEALANVGVAIDKADQASLDAADAVAAASSAETTATAADSRSTDALATANTALATAQSTLASAGVTATAVADLVAPFYVAHRGGANLLPESALETYRAVRDRGGVGMVEADVYVLRDGSTIVMHDGTVDRTTAQSASTDKLTAAGVQRLRIDAGSWFLTGWPSDLRVPTLDDFLDTVGRTLTTTVEAKNAGAGQAIADRVVSRGLEASTLVQSFILAELDPAIAAGIPSAYLHTDGVGVDWAAVAAQGVQWALLGTGAAQAAFDAAAAEGLRLGVWTVDRRVDRDTFLAWGVELIFTDDPWYLGDVAPLLEDPFDSATWGDGMIGSTIASVAARGTFASGGWKIDATVGGFGSCLQGWACPIDGDPAASSWQLDFKVIYEAVNYGTAWGSVWISSNDLGYSDDGATGRDGYHLLFRQSGKLDVYRVDDGATTLLGTVTCSSAPAVGASRDYRIVVSPTQITLSCPGVGAPNSVTVTDSTYRGGYIAFGARDARVRFTDVLVS